MSLTLCTPNTHICVWVWSNKRTRKKKKKMFHSWDRTRDFRIGRLVSYPLGHQGSWVSHERLCSYSFVNRVNYDTQIKHSACKGLSYHGASAYSRMTSSMQTGALPFQPVFNPVTVPLVRNIVTGELSQPLGPPVIYQSHNLAAYPQITNWGIEWATFILHISGKA